MNVPKPLVLIILDGWGIAPDSDNNPISKAKTPFLKKLWYGYPHCKLLASGEAVGLPRGEAGNSEIGHLNLGAGFVVYQDLVRINHAIADGSFFQNEAFFKAFEHIKANQSNLHLLGLIGPALGHSCIEHLFSLLRLCHDQKITNIFIHAFTDGRDSPPTSAQIFLSEVENFVKNLGTGRLATICGRYYAMDRERHWERTQKAYDLLTLGKGKKALSFAKAISDSYKSKITDEFIEPTFLLDENQKPFPNINDNDSIIFFNFRNDRPRQLTESFVLPNFEGFERLRKLSNLFFVTMTDYEKGLPISAVAFKRTNIEEPASRVIAESGLHQLHIAESTKFPHVTYFFNGGREDPFPMEDRIEIPSPKVKTYDEMPEMSTWAVAEVLKERILGNIYDFILVNFASPDMVAHTGVFEAGIKAAEITDQVLQKIVPAITLRGGAVIVTSDHGNLEVMIDPDTGATDTEHNVSPVPFIFVKEGLEPQELPMGILADVAPTILDILKLEKPSTMTARNLLE